MYGRYLLLSLVTVLLTIVTIIIAPILPLFATEQKGKLNNGSAYGIGPRLPFWLNWFQTPDNSLDGDDGFQKENGTGYLAKIKWLRRNPAYQYGVEYISGQSKATYIGDPTIRDNDNAKEGWCFVRTESLFQFRYVKQIFNTDRCLYFNFGWNIMALVDDNVNPKPDPYEATLVFSPRLSGFR